MKKLVEGLLEKSGKEKDFPLSLSFLVDPETDNIVISGEHDDELFNRFEEFAYRNYAEGRQPRLYTSHEYEESVESSDRLHEGAVSYLDELYNSPAGQMSDLLADTAMGDMILVFSDSKYLRRARDELDGKIEGIVGIYS